MGRRILKIIEFEKLMLLLIGLLGLWVIWPFVTAILFAIVTAYSLNPMVGFLKKYLRSYNLSLFITLLIIFAPLGWLITTFAGGVNVFVGSVSEFSTEVNNILVRAENVLTSISLGIPGMEKAIGSLQSTFTEFVEKTKQSMIESVKDLPLLLLNFLIYIFATYYFLRDGEKIKKSMQEYVSRLEKEERAVLEGIIEGLSKSLRVLFVSYVAMSIIIGVLAWIGYYALEIPYAALMALITALFGFLPILNTPMIYGGISAYLLYLGDVDKAIFLLTYGVVFLSFVPDLVIRPALGARMGNVHPLTILLGFFGGPLIFGIKGFLLGPMILVIAETVFKEYLKHKLG